MTQRQMTVARPTELAAIDDLITDPSERPRAVVLTGEAGIGKSTVWSAGVELAREAGWLVLATRGNQTETGLSFASLTDLLDPVLDQVLDRLPPTQRMALEVAMVRRLPGTGQLGTHEVGTAAAAAVRELCREHRLLVAIDDLPWVDRATAEAFGHALSRLAHERVRVLATRRTASPLAAAAPPAPDLLPADDVRTVPITAIDATAATDLLADRLDLRLPTPVVRGLVEHSGGNPFWILEFGAALLRLPPTVLRGLVDHSAGNPFWILDVDAALRRGEGDRPALPTLPVPTALPIPTALADLVRERLSSLSAEARQALVVTAALPQPSSDLVVRALAGLAGDSVGASAGDSTRDPAGSLSADPAVDPSTAVNRAIADGVLILSESQRLRPAHPLLGAAALDALLPMARASLHRRLAELVDDPEQRARHLMLAAGDPPEAATADQLAAGAAAARDRGAVSTAVELADLAVRFTPPASADAVARRQAATAELHYMRGDVERARELAAAIWSSDGAEPLIRRRAMAMLAHTLLYTQGPPAAQQVVDEALAGSADDPWLRSLALAFAADFNVASDAPYARRCAVEAIRICDDLGAEAEPAALATALLALAEIDMFDGLGLDRSLFERARAAQADGRWIPFIERAEVRYALSAKYVDDLDTSRTLLTRLLRAAQDVGESSATLILQAHLAYTEVQAGRPDAARAALTAFDQGDITRLNADMARLKQTAPAALAPDVQEITSAVSKVVAGGSSAADQLNVPAFQTATRHIATWEIDNCPEAM